MNIASEIWVFTTPNELRKLADDMEKTAKIATLGQSLSVQINDGKNHVKFSFDQSSEEYKELRKNGKQGTAKTT